MARGHTFTGIHLPIHNNLPIEIFAQSAVRYKQAMVVDLLCTGHSLNLSEGLAERRRPIGEQLPPAQTAGAVKSPVQFAESEAVGPIGLGAAEVSVSAFLNW